MKYHQEKLAQISLLGILFALFLFWPNHAAAATDAFEPLYQSLVSNAGYHAFWRNIMDMVNGLVIVIMIFVAFSEILRLNINTYGIKKVLPTLVFAVIAANFSWIFVRLFVDFANILMTRFSSGSDLIDPLAASRKPFLIDVNSSDAAINLSSPVTTGVSLFQAMLRTVFVWIGAIVLYILGFLLLIRNAMIIFLAVVSPVAFMSIVLPTTKTLFNTWWKNFVNWVFLPVVATAILWVGAEIYNSVGQGDALLGFIFGVGFIIAAVSVPFKMGGSMMQKWGDLGKKAWGNTGGKALDAGKGAVVGAAKYGYNAAKDNAIIKAGNTKWGQWIREQAKKPKVNDALRKAALDKLDSNAERKVYKSKKNEYDRIIKQGTDRQNAAIQAAETRMGRQLSDDEKKAIRDKMPPLSPDQKLIRGRIVRQVEKFSQEEVEPVRDYDAKTIREYLTGKGNGDINSAFNNNGLLKDEAELLKMDDDRYYEVKGALMRLKQLMNQTRTDIKEDVAVNILGQAAGGRQAAGGSIFANQDAIAKFKKTRIADNPLGSTGVYDIALAGIPIDEVIAESSGRIDSEMAGIKMIADHLRTNGDEVQAMERLTATLNDLANRLGGKNISELDRGQQAEIAEQVRSITKQSYTDGDGNVETDRLERDFQQVRHGIEHFGSADRGRLIEDLTNPNLMRDLEGAKRAAEAAKIGAQIAAEHIASQTGTISGVTADNEAMERLAGTINEGFKQMTGKESTIKGSEVRQMVVEKFRDPGQTTTIKLDEIQRGKLADALGNSIHERFKKEPAVAPRAPEVATQQTVVNQVINNNANQVTQSNPTPPPPASPQQPGQFRVPGDNEPPGQAQ
jgi:hypothetical protein